MAHNGTKTKETFPPKWLLVLAILAVVVGTIWTGVRITAAEGKLASEARETSAFAQKVDDSLCATAGPSRTEACTEAASKAAEPTAKAANPFEPPSDGKNGVDGQNGLDGKPGSDGKPGKDGLKGVDGLSIKGADGLTIPGADGISGTDGAPGAPGESIQGDPGTPGRGLADLHCQDNGQWRITYTDGTVDNEGGKCREDPAPTPAPTPSPSPPTPQP